ncbi:hypothetical protein WOLCODRAFT_82480 [Wolfiporia cocos MD-104 SS10]|uniref:Chromo domain-containing protein n=1 Tax=Wolfiporia cocos (strain MD-104) TaxID=742152 RepID=A0A2H3J3D1_WOLCO|nr:hypothetical protein WOLCODRAFT_82480 [Wolfiporia cocos MD-104 SS10]
MVKKVPFKVGDKVMIDVWDYQTSERSLAPHYIGPFKIIKQLSPVTFRLHLDAQYRAYHPVFHASKLVPYTGSQEAPDPDEHGEYEVEEILDHRYSRPGGKLQLLVRWKGYTQGEDTWKDKVALQNAKEIVDEYKQKHKLNDAPGRRSAHNPRIKVADPEDDPDWKVGDRYLWSDDWPLINDSMTREE